MIEFISFVEKSSPELMDFKQSTQIVSKFMLFSNRVAYEYMLVLEPELEAFVLINNVVFLLPELIEYNGHIRAIASSIKDGSFSDEQREHMIVEIEKIEENLNKLDYTMGLLKKIDKKSHFKGVYEKMVFKQKEIIYFVETILAKKDNTLFIEPNGLYLQITECINHIIDFNNVSLSLLKGEIKDKLDKSAMSSIYTLASGVGLVLFIVAINRLFYIRNKMFIEKIEELTITDGMSGLYNRRYFDKVFEDSLKIQQRTKQLLVFIMLDIDFFKQYNDTYGHQAGDMAFRLGGEEFGILCVGMNEADVLAFANNIRTNVENEQIEHKHSKVSSYLTISMGVIIIKAGHIENVSHVYKCADKALYEAKENGRNRVALYDAEVFCGIG